MLHYEVRSQMTMSWLVTWITGFRDYRDLGFIKITTVLVVVFCAILVTLA